MNIMIVDDHEIIREGLSLILKQAYCVDNLLYAADGYEAIKIAESFLADLVLLDLSMPGGLDGLATLEKLRKLLPEAKIVIFTMFDNIAFQKKVFDAGADGYLIKQLNRDAIIDSLDQILASYKVFDEKAVTAFSESDTKAVLDLPITNREKEVLILTVLGYTLKDISKKMDITVKTVENHRQKIGEKLETHKRHDWVEIAQKHNLIEM